MRSNILMIMCFVFLSFQAKAQTNKHLSDSIADLYKRYLELEKAHDANIKSAGGAVNSLEKKLGNVENQASATAEKMNELGKRVNQFDENDVVNAKTLYVKSKTSFIQTAFFMEKVDEALRDINSAIANFSYSTTITKLNNPTNNELGFSLDKAVIKILEDKILSQMKRKPSFIDKLKDVVKNIITNPLISPFAGIARALTTNTVPAVSSISSVFNVVQNMAVTDNNISVEALRNFTNELQKYVQHYEALAKASQELENSLAQLKLKMESLRKLAENFSQQNIEDIYGKDGLPDLSKMPLEELTKKYLNFRKVNEFVESVETNTTGTSKYNTLAKRFVFPAVGRSKAAFIIEELEKLNSEYLAGLDSYQKNILVVLENAKKISDEPNAINTKIVELNTQYDNVVKAYIKSIEITEVRDAEANIPRR